MTTIAYRDGVLAADGLCTRDGTVVEFRAEKIRRLENGDILALCGTSYVRQIFAEWWLDRTKPQPDLTESSAIVLTADGLLEYEGNGQHISFTRIRDEFSAWGSGATAALGAMHMGATALQAVQIAATLDLKTGGEIIALSYEEPAKLRILKAGEG